LLVQRFEFGYGITNRVYRLKLEATDSARFTRRRLHDMLSTKGHGVPAVQKFSTPAAAAPSCSLSFLWVRSASQIRLV